MTQPPRIGIKDGPRATPTSTYVQVLYVVVAQQRSHGNVDALSFQIGYILQKANPAAGTEMVVHAEEEYLHRSVTVSFFSRNNVALPTYFKAHTYIRSSILGRSFASL